MAIYIISMKSHSSRVLAVQGRPPRDMVQERALTPRSCAKKMSVTVRAPRHSPAPDARPRMILPASSAAKDLAKATHSKQTKYKVNAATTADAGALATLLVMDKQEKCSLYIGRRPNLVIAGTQKKRPTPLASAVLVNSYSTSRKSSA
jgi:hypothetical protein